MTYSHYCYFIVTPNPEHKNNWITIKDNYGFYVKIGDGQFLDGNDKDYGRSNPNWRAWENVTKSNNQSQTVTTKQINSTGSSVLAQHQIGKFLECEYISNPIGQIPTQKPGREWYWVYADKQNISALADALAAVGKSFSAFDWNLKIKVTNAATYKVSEESSGTKNFREALKLVHKNWEFSQTKAVDEQILDSKKYDFKVEEQA